MRTKGTGVLSGLVGLGLVLGPVAAQEKAPAPGLAVGPATVSPHWSKYDYPRTIPEGAAYHIVERGDTMWDLAGRYLGNAFLWPQIWDANRYVTDAHWIYPGDPLILPRVALVSERAGEPGAPPGAPGVPGVPGAPTEPGAAPAAGEPGAPALYPVTEEITMQCAHYIVPQREDESLRVLGSEQGAAKLSFADRDILYLDKGRSGGLKAGDVYTLHHPSYKVKHPATGKTVGTKVETTGWARVILADENSATAVVEQACVDIHPGDYLKPYEKVNVPLILRRPHADRLTPPSGKAQGYVIDIADDADAAGEGQLVSLDLGSESGLAPGSILVVYRIVYPSVPTSRNVLGEVSVLSVRERTATAKVIYSADHMLVGDQVELR